MDSMEKFFCGLAGIAGGIVLLVVVGQNIPKSHEEDLAKMNRAKAQAEVDAFKNLSPKEHLELAKKAFQEEQYLEMDRHLSALDIAFPGVKELKNAYLAKMNKLIQARRDEKANEVKAKHKENKLKVPEIGMDSDTVYECSWGIPEHINRTKTALGTSEQWVYQRHGRMQCVYLENNVVTAIQD